MGLAESIRRNQFTIGAFVALIDIPDSASGHVAEVLRLIAEGLTPVVMAAEAFLTTQEAADMLNVSRPTVVKLVNDGLLPAEVVGVSHRRLKLADVLAYRAERNAQREAALTELIAEAADLDLPD